MNGFRHFRGRDSIFVGTPYIPLNSNANTKDAKKASVQMKTQMPLRKQCHAKCIGHFLKMQFVRFLQGGTPFDEWDRAKEEIRKREEEETRERKKFENEWVGKRVRITYGKYKGPPDRRQASSQLAETKNDPKSRHLYI